MALWRFLPDADIADFLAEHEGSSHQQRTLLPTIVDQTLEFKIFNQPRVWDSLAAVPEATWRFCRDRLQLDVGDKESQKIFLEGTAHALRQLLPQAIRHTNRMGAPKANLEVMGFTLQGNRAMQQGATPPRPPPRSPPSSAS